MAEIGTDIEKAATILNTGGLVGIPTDTLYGLAANALDESAVKEVYSIKQRPLEKALVIQINDVSHLTTFCKTIPDAAWSLAKHFWPGALTLVLEKKTIIPDIVTAGKSTVGVRIPDHHMTLELLSSLGYPLVVPSANISGLESPSTTHQVNQQLPDISYILDGGACSIGVESTIVGFEEEEIVILRQGAISQKDIYNALNKELPS